MFRLSKSKRRVPKALAISSLLLAPILGCEPSSSGPPPQTAQSAQNVGYATPTPQQSPEAAPREPTIVRVPSQRDLLQTVHNLETELNQENFEVVERTRWTGPDETQLEASEAWIVRFRDPSLEPIIRQDPNAALALPNAFLVHEAEDGTVYITYESVTRSLEQAGIEDPTQRAATEDAKLREIAITAAGLLDEPAPGTQPQTSPGMQPQPGAQPQQRGTQPQQPGMQPQPGTQPQQPGMQQQPGSQPSM